MIIQLQNNDKLSIFKLEKLFSNVFLNGDIEKELYDNPYTKIFIYVKNNDILGFIEIYCIYDRLEIANFNVLNKYQNNHIGSKLLEYIVNYAIDNNMKNITLEVRNDNDKAIYLYEKYEFKKISIRKNYYGKVDGILMKRDIKEEKDVYILGIESSCDETSFSIVKNGVEEIATVTSSQIDIHKLYGGVVPEIASRAHIKNITFVLEECLKKANMKVDDVTAIAVTYGPGLIGSLLVGVECAKTLSFLYNKPLIPVHHISGHIYANNLVKRLEFPLIALVISGGHTELILMEKDFYQTRKHL